ncbi:MAG: hypothetical protein ACON4H_13860 [Rubripirellula sp.]
MVKTELSWGRKEYEAVDLPTTLRSTVTLSAGEASEAAEKNLSCRQLG